MEITYESICKNLGYDLKTKLAERKAEYKKNPWLINDNWPDLYAGLSEEELHWILDNDIVKDTL